MARLPGTPNKDTQSLIDLAHKKGINPFEILLNIANGDWKALGYKEDKTVVQTKTGLSYVERITMDHRMAAAAHASQYLYPKRKSVEIHSTSEEAQSKLVINFGGKGGDKTVPGKVDSGEPVQANAQAVPESPGHDSSELPLPPLVQTDSGVSEQTHNNRDSGTTGNQG